MQHPLMVKTVSKLGTEELPQLDKEYLQKPPANMVLNGETREDFPRRPGASSSPLAPFNITLGVRLMP